MTSSWTPSRSFSPLRRPLRTSANRKIHSCSKTCQRCKIGGFTCIPNPLGVSSPSSSSSAQSSVPKQRPASTATMDPLPQLSISFPITLEAAYPPPTAQIPFAFDFGAPLSSVSNPGELPFTHAYPPTSPTGWPQLQLSTTSAYDPFADLTYSSTLLSLFNSLSPMPSTLSLPAQAMRNSFLVTQAPSTTSSIVSGTPGADLRAFVIRELAEGEELGDLEGTRHVEEAMSICEYKGTFQVSPKISSLTALTSQIKTSTPNGSPLSLLPSDPSFEISSSSSSTRTQALG